MQNDNELSRRFITYMASLIHYNSINYDKNRRKKESRFPLTIDNDENVESSLLAATDPELEPPNLEDHISNNLLYHAFESLSAQQQKILSFSYVENLSDKEIARVLGVTQQNISKHRLKALTKLRQIITKG